MRGCIINQESKIVSIKHTKNHSLKYLMGHLANFRGNAAFAHGRPWHWIKFGTYIKRTAICKPLKIFIKIWIKVYLLAKSNKLLTCSPPSVSHPVGYNSDEIKFAVGSNCTSKKSKKSTRLFLYFSGNFEVWLQAAIHLGRAAYFSFFTRIPNTHTLADAKATGRALEISYTRLAAPPPQKVELGRETQNMS